MPEEKTVKIKHLKRFNGFDEGHIREVSEEDADVWIGEKLCKIAPKNAKLGKPAEKEEEESSEIADDAQSDSKPS